MRQTRLIMGMPVHLEIADAGAPDEAYESIFAYFREVDERFSTYKPESEISRMNRGEVPESDRSEEMQEAFRLAEEAMADTDGYFDIRTPDGLIDPSGIIKGWAIQKAAEQLSENGYENYYIEIGGDIQVRGHDLAGKDWSIGIRNPFNADEIVKVIVPRGKGVATSGSYIRGHHIYDPHSARVPEAFVSLTVIGPNVYEADRFATAAFAMGEKGLLFLEQLPGFEAYAIDPSGIATYTSGFDAYTAV